MNKLSRTHRRVLLEALFTPQIISSKDSEARARFAEALMTPITDPRDLQMRLDNSYARRAVEMGLHENDSSAAQTLLIEFF